MARSGTIRLFPVSILLALVAAVGLASWIGNVRRRLHVGPIQPTGAFAQPGGIPAYPAPSPGSWSSWNGRDDDRGSLAIGPFRAPRTLGLQVAGYPGHPGNALYLENARTGAVFDPAIGNLGEEWNRVLVAVPSAWRGQPVVLHAIDDAGGWGGWLAVSEPYAVPSWSSWWYGTVPMRALVILIASGMLLFCALSVAGTWLIERGWVDEPAMLLLAAGAVSLVAYATFWVYFADATAGVVVTWTLILGAVLTCAWPRQHGRVRALWTNPDWWQPALLMVGVAAFSFAVLMLFATDDGMSLRAQERFATTLANDNVVPQLFAERLLTGASPKALTGDWLSSDRPPLQVGWVLLFAKPLLCLGVTMDTAAQCVGMWFQLMWVPAVWMWLRSMNVRRGLAALLIVVLLPSGFLLINTIYPWPKLGGAALVLGAFTLWFARDPARAPFGRRRFAAGGALAALAWLSHGGVAFSLLGMVPVALWRRRAALHGWIAAAAAFALLAAPWVAYQRFYEPPGNRLLKWHLAGVIPVDDRGTWETIRSAYAHASMEELLHARVENLRMMTHGPWEQLVRFQPTPVESRREAELDSTVFALGWWSLGFVALGVIALARARVGSDAMERAGLATSLAWVMATLMLWLLLMFLPDGARARHGSYAPLLVLLPALALALWRLHPALLAVTAAAQWAMFPSVWLTAPLPTAPAHPQTGLLVLLAASVLELGFVVTAGWGRSSAEPVSVRDLQAG